jgi:hypothetical protein
MPQGRRQLFIYWRVAVADVPAALQAARDLHVQLRLRHAELRTGLYLRRDGAAGDATLMESYALASPGGSGGVDVALQHGIEAAGAATQRPWLRGTRHVEVFEACDE